MHGFPLPKRLSTSAGHARRVGVEIEFAGLRIDEITQLVQGLYGGEIQRLSRFEQKVIGTRWGDFGIEIDVRLLKDRGYLKFLEKTGVELDEASLAHAEDLLARIAATLVPHEIVCPPIPLEEAEQLERLRESLQQHHALGTKASLRYAFGLQFNPEIPALDAATVLAYLRAFFLLIDWLEQRSEVALSRRMTPFINPFPQHYVRRVLEPDYAPSLAQLIDDYLLANPTRNRPLDMLPLLAHLDETRVKTTLQGKDIKIRSRPTFHYRLPNCLIDDPEWSIAREWSGWVAVDDLAQDAEKLRLMSADYLEERAQLSLGYDEDWAEQVEAWLQLDR